MFPPESGVAVPDQPDGLVPQTGVSSPQTGVRGLKRLQAEHGRLIFPERGRLIGLGKQTEGRWAMGHRPWAERSQRLECSARSLEPYFDALGADAAGAAGRFPQLLQP